MLQEKSRSNNFSERWHNRFQVAIGKNYPSFYVFLNELRKEQADTEIMQRQLQLDQRIRKGLDRKRRENEEQIMNVVNAYILHTTEHTYVQGNNVYSYLKTVEYHVKF